MMATQDSEYDGKSRLDIKEVQSLKSQLRGAVIQPGEKGYDGARKVWNGMIDRKPALIVQAADAEDISRAVNFGREHQLPVAVRGGGHNVAGFGTVDDGLVIDLSRMKAIQVDPVARTARAEGGLTWADFDQATQEHELATTGGMVSMTGIAGLSLGGGTGWLMRRHGLSADNLLSADVITADGQRVTASETENSDLYWGLRGGGGNFGVVASFEYQLHPVGPMVLGGAAFYPMDKVQQLLRFYGQWAPTLPEELTTMVAFMAAPPEPFVPRDLVGARMVAVALCYAGDVERGTALVKPLREAVPPAIDVIRPMSYNGLQRMFDAMAPNGMRSYWKSEYLHDVNADLADILATHARAATSPLSAIHIQHLEGAIRRLSPGDAAFTHRDARYVMNMIGTWMLPAGDAENVSWVRELWKAVQPFSTGAVYLNFMDNNEGEDRIRAAYGPEKYARLSRIKRKYDPTNFFHVNQNILPAA